MSQPPALPKLTAFLRPGQQQQHYQHEQHQQHDQQKQHQHQQRHQHQRDHLPPPLTRGDGSVGAVEKRRLDHDVATPPPQLGNTMDDSSLHDLHRPKRRANMFVQYGDTNYHPQHHQRHPHQQHQHQQQRHDGGYDRHPHPPSLHAFPSSSPNAQPVSPYGQPSLGDGQLQHPPASFTEYTGTGYGADAAAPPIASQEARRAPAVKAEPPPPSTRQAVLPRARKSRYLSEFDRRSIIARIGHGEKQVALAKEYQVSRAAICNLYKNRKEVLTRADRDAKSKQGKRAKGRGEAKHTPGESRGAATTTAALGGANEKGLSDGQMEDEDGISDASSSTESVDTDAAAAPRSRSPSVVAASRDSGSPAQVQQVYNASTSSSAIHRLVRMLRNAHLAQVTLRQVTKRLLRCLMEEVLVCLPRRAVNVVTSAGDSYTSIQPIEDDQICVILMESQGSLMLQALLDIFPSAPTAFVSTTPHRESSTEEWAVACHHLPHLHDHTSVLLLTMDCATGARVTAVLDYLFSVGHVTPTHIYVVTVISSQPGIGRVHKRFPGVTVISAAIDDGLDDQGRIRPGLGDLMERFWRPNGSPHASS